MAGRHKQPVVTFVGDDMDLLLKTGGSGLPEGTVFAIINPDDGTIWGAGLIDSAGLPNPHPFAMDPVNGFPLKWLTAAGTNANGQLENVNDADGIALTASGIVLTADSADSDSDQPAVDLPCRIARPDVISVRMSYSGTPADEHVFEIQCLDDATATFGSASGTAVRIKHNGTNWRIQSREYNAGVTNNPTPTQMAGFDVSDFLFSMNNQLDDAGNGRYQTRPWASEWDDVATGVTGSNEAVNHGTDLDTQGDYRIRFEALGATTTNVATFTISHIHLGYFGVSS